MQANDYILNDCTFRPLARYGVKSARFHVYSPDGAMIGTYNPARQELSPVRDWNMTFSTKLIDNLGLRRKKADWAGAN